MSRFSRMAAWLLLLLVGPCLPLSSAAGDSGRTLIASNSQTGLRVEISLQDVKHLTIRFFHSYDRQWVEESFCVDKGRFVPSEVTYRDDSYDYRDQRYRSRILVEHDRVRLTAIQPLPSDILTSIATRIAYTRPQQLILHGSGGDRTYFFTQWGLPGQPLAFSIE